MKTLLFVGLLAMALIGSAMADPDTSEEMLDCVCTRNYSPVCATNGVTYDNDCLFKCVQSERLSRGLQTIQIAKRGTCSGESWI